MTKNLIFRNADLLQCSKLFGFLVQQALGHFAEARDPLVTAEVSDVGLQEGEERENDSANISRHRESAALLPQHVYSEAC